MLATIMLFAHVCVCACATNFDLLVSLLDGVVVLAGSLSILAQHNASRARILPPPIRR